MNREEICEVDEMALHRKPHLPTWRDLPLEDGIPLDNQKHAANASTYLRDPLQRFVRDNRLSAFVGNNSFVYYDVNDHRKTLGPELYVVNGGQEEGQGCWVVWAEGGLFPTLCVEMLSPSTESRDRNEKRLIYQDVWHCPDYYLYNTETKRLEGFHLIDGAYVEVVAHPSSGRIPCLSLPLELGVHEGWLRWFTPDGQLVLTDGERADQATRRADEAGQRADEAGQRADEEGQRADEARHGGKVEVARAMMAAGMTLDQVLSLTGLSPDSLVD